MRPWDKHGYRAATFGILLSVVGLSPLQADDTEIFFGQAEDSFNNNPNILFVLDNSGSMSKKDEGFNNVSRIDRLKTAMNSLLDQSSSFNVGLMAFQGKYHGGAIRYPVGYLEADSTEQCDGVCPDELIVSRPDGASNDGTEHDITKEISLNSPTLVMASVDSTTTTTTETTAVETSLTAVATADVSEYTPSDISSTINQHNQPTNRWFFDGDEDHGIGHYAYRFDDIRIPNGATVTQARITFTQTTKPDQLGDVSAYISAEATPAPQPYPTETNETLSLAERRDPLRRTNALVAWDPIPPDNSPGAPADNGSDTKVDTPDLTSVLSELVSQPGWNEGGSMSFLIDPFDFYTANSANIREFHGSTAVASKVPVLSYTYHEAPNPNLTTTRVDAISHVDEVTAQNTQVVSRNNANEVSELFHAGTSNQPRQLALRFDDIAIPSDAIIKNAYLTLTSAAVSASASPATDWTIVDGSGNGLEPSSSSLALPSSAALSSTSASPTTVTTVSANIQAELDANPADYSSSTLEQRTHTSNFINWADIPDTPDTEMVSPDLSALIAQVVALPDWNSGNSISLRMSAPENDESSADQVRNILTASSTEKPELLITWEPNDASTDAVAETQTTAIRFSYVHIPPGATINSAKIVFHSAETNDETTSLDISAELLPSPLPLESTANNIGSRDRTIAQETWVVDPWLTVGTAHDTPDLTRIVQELTDQPDWCGGNPMTFFLAGSGKRVAISADANSIKAPTLEITYAPDTVTTGAYCSNSSMVAQITEAGNDAVQNTISKSVDLSGTALYTDSASDGSGDKQIIGLRFDDVNIPPETNIISAALRLTTNEEITDTAQFSISVEESDNPSVFASDSDNIGDRDWSTSEVVWNSTPPAAANESIFTSDLKTLIAETVGRPGWDYGNAIAFRLEPAQVGNPRSFASFDTSEVSSAQLLIYFESERTSPGTRFRDNLKQHVNELVAQGHTPITSSLYEAALYFRSQAVDYGRRRGAKAWEDRFHRVSHPFSYEGGDLSRPAGCSDADLDSDACITEVINNNSSTATYVSPMDSQCQTNHIVLLSDGVATSNTARTKIQSMTTSDECDTSYSTSEQCGRELVEWMNLNDHSDFLPGMQNIITHTIAFNLAEADRGFLSDLAELGGGGSYSADSATSLLSAFQSIFLNVSKTDTSFVAPAVTLNQQNRMKNREDLYYAMFKPESTARWNGNLKKFKLQGAVDSEAIIVDRNLVAAVDAATGSFKDSSRSFWSTVNDGASVKLGGAASRLKDETGSHLSRNVYTYTGTTTDLTHEDNQLLPGNSNITTGMFSLSSSLAADSDYYEKLVNWARGKDVLDQDGDENFDEPRGQMGDPLHSQPVLVTYGDGTDETSIIYVATNEGYLHAIDTATGDEKFAFIPQELLKNMQKLMTDEPTLRRPYGLDGGMTTWIQDTNKNGIIESGDSAYLYIGMRRGGNQYYALDITDFDSPEYMWSIQGRTGDFVELGDTWSRPIKTRVRDGTSLVDVLVFGGGYDPNQDPTTSSSSDDTAEAESRSTDGVGRAIFIANATTGAKLWQTSRISPDFQHMNYSIPSEVRVIDIDFDGLADQLYVGDMGGQIFRLDINNDASLTGSLTTRIDGDRIASLAGDDPADARRFYYPPDVSIISIDDQQQLAISIGSGWRAHPLDDVVQDRFYNLRLNSVYGKPIDSYGVTQYPDISTDDLLDVTDTINPTMPADKQGWFMDLEGSGEKVLSSSVTADHKVLFTTYLPEVDSVACAAAEGTGAVYVVNVLNGSPVFDLADPDSTNTLTIEDRSRLLNHAGIPPSTSILFPETGDATVVVGTENLQEFKLDELRRRTFWQENIEEDS